MATFNSPKHAFARERITVGAGVVQLSESVYAPGSTKERATGARIVVCAGSGDISFVEMSDETPTGDITTAAGVGTGASAGDVIYLESFDSIYNFQAIRISTDAILEVVYYRG